MPNADLIDGKKLAKNIRSWVKQQVAQLYETERIVPGLAVILVGDDPASQIYVRNKGKQSREAGMHSVEYLLPNTASETEIIERVNALNSDDSIDGILVQLPFPNRDLVSEHIVTAAIDPSKDVDGLHVLNAGKLTSGEEGLFPATPTGCILMLKNHAQLLSGKHAIVVGRSNLVGKPIAAMLLRENCTVTIAHSRTNDLQYECKRADIIIAATGKPEMIRGNWIKEGAIVIDVGINRLLKNESEKPKLVGDVAFQEAVRVAAAITPVPGGVGPMTIACLLINTLKAAHMRRGLLFQNLDINRID